jgi:fimbrial isopeptide formation D2 family protein
MKRIKGRNFQALLSFCAGLAVVAGIAVFLQAQPGKAAYLGCSPNGYLVKDSGGHTDVQAIDMVTGQGSSAGQVPSHALNAIGYNPKDNHFYAWNLAGAGSYVQLDASFNVTGTFTMAQIGYSGPVPATQIYSGDVDEDGYHWVFGINGSTTHWYKIDTSLSTPSIVDFGTTPNPTDPPDTLSEGADWAYIPGTNKLYRAMDNGTDITIVAFDRTAQSFSVVGKVTNITGTTSDLNMGAVYADPDGNFYMSSNGSGTLWRVDLSASPPFTAVQLDAADVGSNDGARCVLASVPVDLSDAPAGYDTVIAADGPRHGIINFDLTNSTASLMLGKNIDIEADGIPNADATGDDADHEGVPGGPFVDDERGVTHIIATSGVTTPLTVPVYVTNTSPQTGVLVGWIDLDNDGSFETTERINATVPAGFTGYQQLTFPSPPAPYSANTFARFRLFSSADSSTAAAGMLSTGPASGGEVEDVQVQIGAYDVDKTANPADGSRLDPGQTVTYTLTIRNTGTADLTNLKIDDDLTDVLDDATIQGPATVNPSAAGTAQLYGNTLEFTGDVNAGQTVTVTYTVKVKDGGSLGNAGLQNTILAAHSAGCHPTVGGGGNVTVSDPDCQTVHPVNGLAKTGSSVVLPLLLAGGLFTVAGVILYLKRPLNRRPNSQ